MDASDSSPGSDTVSQTVAYLSDVDGPLFGCAQVMRREIREPPEKRVLIFSVTESAEELDNGWDRYVGEDVTPDKVALIIASPSPNKNEHVSTAADSGTPIDVMYTDPNDLTGIAMAFSQLLESWGGEPTLVCLRELDALTRYHESDTVFQFVNSLVQTLREANTHVHAHIRPETMDDTESKALASLFNRIEEARE